ncbi:hypothetical protein JCM3775_006688 [Rhodotorula graminis]
MAALASAEALSSAATGAQNPTEVLYLVAVHFIDSFISLLSTSVTSDEHITFASQLSSGSTIGKHARHLADHYRLLLDGTSRASASSSSPIEFSYDIRSRNLAAETSHAACVESFEQLRAQLAEVTREGHGVDPERAVRLHATTPFEVEVGSSFARELWFASFHAVHHFALIRDRDRARDRGAAQFGVAPSTLVHRKESDESSAHKGPKL